MVVLVMAQARAKQYIYIYIYICHHECCQSSHSGLQVEHYIEQVRSKKTQGKYVHDQDKGNK